MKGIGASPGIAIGRARLFKKKEATASGVLLQGDEAIALEIVKYNEAVQHAVADVEAIKITLIEGDEGIDILEAHIELLGDEQIKEDVLHKISTESRTANDAVVEVIHDAAELFRNMDDEYFKARAADIEDIGNRILSHLNKTLQADEKPFDNDTIIIAADLAPSDTITMDITKIAGFATQFGGKTSHAAIIAKAKSIPAVVGCGVALQAVEENDIIVIDGNNGHVIVNPHQTFIDECVLLRSEYSRKAAKLKLLNSKPAITIDGKAITLLANISNADDLEESFNYGSEGSGLLRTELLFMGRDSMPTEDEQFAFYKQVAIKSKQKPVIVRTLDIGGDKQLPYFKLPVEENPFLGYRAIRLCLDRKDIFMAQLKAILRASAFGNFKIMFPMISNVQEVRQAKQILQEAKEELNKDNIAFDAAIQVGIMIEIPSAAVTADILAKEVDFFSIGTNDLCQYTLAVDRMNDKIKHLYEPFNPGVLRLIQNVIEQGHRHNIHVGMCGELAGDPLATMLLLGMGLTEFSMSAPSIPYIKSIILNGTIEKAKEVCKNVMEMDSAEAITTYLKQAGK